MKNKVVWMCWFQGEDALKKKRLNRACTYSWKKINPDWEIRLLQDDHEDEKKTIRYYVPEYYKILKESPHRSMAAKSDLLRLLLLSKFGGVWADASVFLVVPLDRFINNIINETGFFAYKFRKDNKSRRGRLTCSWFLCVNKSDHILINKWKSLFIDRFKNNLTKWRFFTLHNCLSYLYKNDNEIKKIIDDMHFIEETFPHSCVGANKIEDTLPSFMYKRPSLKLIKQIVKENS